MNSSFLRWALLVIAIAGAAFIAVWNLLDNPRSSPDGALESRAVQSSDAGQALAQSAAPQSAAPSPAPLSTRVLFAFDRATLDSAETAKLTRLAEAIKGTPVERLDAVGHADRIGSEMYNLNLSQRRAEAVRGYLTRLGIDASVVRTYAKGETEPVSGDDCIGLGPETRRNRTLIECLQPDRRVAVTVLRRG